MDYKDEFENEERNLPNSYDTSVPANTGEESEVKREEKEEKNDFVHSQSLNDAISQIKEEPNYSYEKTEQTRSSNFDEVKKSKKSPIKGIASTLAAGVIGSVLTLAVLPHTDYLKNLNDSASANYSQPANDVVKPVTAQPAVDPASSIADTVQRVSKDIVGIVNYQQQQQQQQNSNDLFGNGNGNGNDPFGNSNGGGYFGNDNNNSTSSQAVETGSGSGIIFQKSNNSAYIVTNNHVVEGASKLEISLYNGTKTTAQVVGTDALTDLAVLKIDGKYVSDTATFGDSSKLRPGDPVYAIGNPLGLDLSRTVTSGIVSAINRSISVNTSAGNWQTNVIQTDAAINPGNSGGALINTAGQVIGINSLKISESGVEGLGFAIPSNDFIPIVNQLIKNGKIVRPYIGVGLEDLNQIPQVYWQDLPNNVQQGVMITNVDPNSSAAAAGFRVKDVIVSMNGTPIGSSTDLRKYLYTKENIGDTVKFGVYRNGKLINLNVKLSKSS